MIARAAMERSLFHLRSHPLRTGLTLSGIVLGVAAVVAMVSIGAGAQQQILAVISSVGAEVVQIRSRPLADEKLSDVVNDSPGLSRSDVLAIRSAYPDHRSLAYRGEWPLGVSDLPGDWENTRVFGVSKEGFAVHGLHVTRGRPLLPCDHNRRARVAVLGNHLAQRSFPGGAVGRRIRVEYTYFEVVGVLAEIASGGDLPVRMDDYNDAIVVPFDTAVEELHPPKVYNELSLVSVAVRAIEETTQAKQVLEPLLLGLHGKVNDFDVVAPEEILAKREETQRILSWVLTAIAAISLLVGGIGVMNIMLANILERINEIGLLRAIGARKSDVRNQFLFESTLISLVGGLFGIVLGVTISLVAQSILGLPLTLAVKSMMAAFGLSALVGIVFGLMPALRAANINPIEALQHE